MTAAVPTQPATRGRGTSNILKHFAEGLTRVPGMWLPYPLIPNSKAAMNAAARKVRTGSPAFPAGKFEAKIEDGKLLVRAVG